MLVQIGRKARRAGRGLRLVIEWQRLLGRLVRERPDVVQFGVLRFPFLALGIGRLRRAGITVTQVCHEFEERDGGSLAAAFARITARRVHGSFDLLFLHGEANRRRFHEVVGLPAERTVAIRHGNESLFVDGSGEGDLRSRYGTGDRPVALFFGGLRPSKGLPDLIEAFGTAAAETNAHLLIVGQPVGIDPADLERQAERGGFGDRITIDPGYLPIEEIGPLMRTADVVVLPYRTAAASGVLLTAYTFARPVVATATGALAEDVLDGDTGFLVAPGDVEAMGRALVKILSSPAEAKRMGKAAARMAGDEFAWDRIGQRVLDATEALR